MRTTHKSTHAYNSLGETIDGLEIRVSVTAPRQGVGYRRYRARRVPSSPLLTYPHFLPCPLRRARHSRNLALLCSCCRRRVSAPLLCARGIFGVLSCSVLG